MIHYHYGPDEKDTKFLDRQEPGDTKNKQKQNKKTTHTHTKPPDQVEIDTDSLLQQPKRCIYHGPDDGSFMIACDFCDEWFHGK